MPAELRAVPKAPGAAPDKPPAPAPMGAPAALRFFVSNRLNRLHKTKRRKRLDRWRSYVEGEQYKDRPYDCHGCYPTTHGLVSSFAHGPDGITPWKHRQIDGVINIAADIADQLTDWAVVGPSFCEISVTGDDDATAWLAGLAKESGLRHATEAAVFTAGGCGAAAVSVSWYQDAIDPASGGAARFEVHEPSHCWPLSWADRANLVPHEVVKVFRPVDEYAEDGKNEPDEGYGDYVLRYWSGRSPDGLTPGVEGYWLARIDPKTGLWTLTELSPPVAHGSPRCPVFWVPRGDVPEHEGFDGRPFFAGAEGLIDAANELSQAADNTSKRNAEDTLSIKDAHPDRIVKSVKKGALGAIVSTGGAEYLSQKGDSAKLLYELANQRAQQAYRQSHVIKVDVETLSRQTTGEALKRLFSAQINEADNVRLWIQKWFLLPACAWLLASSRAMVAVGLKVRMPMTSSTDEEGEVTYSARVPGTGTAVELTWPQAFPPTPEDAKAAAETVKSAIEAGALSRETGVRVLINAGVPAGDPKAELKRIQDDAAEAAENGAKAIGLAEGEKTKAIAENTPAEDTEADE